MEKPEEENKPVKPRTAADIVGEALLRKIDRVEELEAENKALREEIERLKAEQKGTVPRMFRCSSTGCTWPNCDCGKL